jgi:two-component system sensor histidine kinase VicK
MDPSPDKSIFASLPYGLCIVDDQGEILNINPTLERLLGWRLLELRGQTLSRYLQQGMIDPTQALSWAVALSEALGQGQTTHLNLPTEFRTGFDDERLVSITGVVAPCQSPSAEHPKAMVIFHDSTSQKDSEGARTRFLAVLAHELGTPVTNLTAATDLLVKRVKADDEALRRLLRVICNEANRLRRLLTQFHTTLSDPTAVPQPRKRLVTLRPVLREVAQAFGVRDLGCQVVVQVPPDLPFVWSDTERIQQVLSKLVDNAIRYAPPGSYVALAAEERGDEIVVSVQDRGPGVPKEDEEMLFEPWCRGSQEEPATEHQGLGLAMAHILVQSLSGRLWHEKPLDGGASFCFSLPRAQGLPDEEEERERNHGSHHPDR